MTAQQAARSNDNANIIYRICDQVRASLGVKFCFVSVSLLLFVVTQVLFVVARSNVDTDINNINCCTSATACAFDDVSVVWSFVSTAIRNVCNIVSTGVPWRFWLWFLVWTLAEYSFHRLCHIKAKYNPLWKLHRYHHAVPLTELTKKEHRWPKLLYFCFWFENFKETLEILLGETLPAVLIYLVDPECGLPLLAFHYVYEIVATDSLLEHNPDIDQEEIISTLAVGQFHLEHHRNPGVNFGFTITLWDHLFGTFKKPKVAA